MSEVKIKCGFGKEENEKNKMICEISENGKNAKVTIESSITIEGDKEMANKLIKGF